MGNPYASWIRADHVAARQAILAKAPRTVRLRCDQNTIFGCGKVTATTPSYRPIGLSAVAQSAYVRCQCGLPLALHRTLRPSERPRSYPVRHCTADPERDDPEQDDQEAR